MSQLPTAVLAELLSIRFGDGDSLEKLLGRFLEASLPAIPDMDDMSVTLIRGEKPFTAGFVGQRSRAADELQYQRGYGPCLDAGYSGEILVIEDMREETRWPDYTSAVVSHDILSAVSVPLPLQTNVLGALNWYGAKPGVQGETVAAGVELASHLAVAISNAVGYREGAELAAQMQEAMASRAVIEQAKGAIMVQNRCGPDRAFEILRLASMGRNVKLRDLAQDIVERLQEAPAQPS